ncbi:rhodanese-like domain-containing protein [Specibacter sp. RAF43]|uniref:rhodanese-like domain-containing protein n=1 Tax=Specibacter sp. RAF43 TaxID=3233057 RepID=UPI003F95CB79
MSYAGDLAPAQAWERLADGAVLVDVRTDGEWAHIGVPDVSALGAEPVFIQWNFSTGAPNPDFLAQLQELVPAERTVVMLCRSGARSVSAAEAATAAGYTAFNMLEGFEGVPDGYGERTVNGWKNRNLPWK